MAAQPIFPVCSCPLSGDAANATVANATLSENRERVASAAGSVVEGGKSAAAGLLSGARSFFSQNSSRDSETLHMLCHICAGPCLCSPTLQGKVLLSGVRIGPGYFIPGTSNHSLYLIKIDQAPAILGKTWEGTSY